MKNYQIEHYNLASRYVAVVMTPDRTALQAWKADKNSGSLVRDDTLILDVIDLKGTSFISEANFSGYCSKHGIRNKIPEKDIERTLRLAANVAFHAVNIIPLPQSSPIMPPPETPGPDHLMSLRVA